MIAAWLVAASLCRAAEPAALPPSAAAQREALIGQILPYFREGAGVDPISGYPFDALAPHEAPAQVAQPTAIGMRLELLGHVLAGDVRASEAERRSASAAAEKLLANLREDQAALGHSGLIPWMALGPRRRALSDEYAYIDNANLSVSLMSFLGSLERAGLDSPARPLAEAVLERQLDGYARLFDGQAGLFWGAVSPGREPSGYHVDRLFSEHRVKSAAIAAALAPSRPRYAEAFARLSPVYRDYRFADGRSRPVPAPWNGALFQNSWNAGYEAGFARELPELTRANIRFLRAAEDEARRSGRRGFLSASAVPGPRRYDGSLGLPQLSEHPEEAASGAESIYAVAPYFALRPAAVLRWFARFDARGPYGPFDAVGPEGPIRRYYAVDQGSSILGLIGRQGRSLRAYLDARGWTDRLIALYRGHFPPASRQP